VAKSSEYCNLLSASIKIRNHWSPHQIWVSQKRLQDGESFIKHLKKKRRLLYLKTQFVPRSKLFSSRLKNQSVHIIWDRFVVYSEINSKQINTVWAERTVVEC
jgi:hypothetical protein